MPQLITRLMSLTLILFFFSTLPIAAQQPRFAELERVVLAELEETKTPGAMVESYKARPSSIRKASASRIWKQRNRSRRRCSFASAR